MVVLAEVLVSNPSPFWGLGPVAPVLAPSARALLLIVVSGQLVLLVFRRTGAGLLLSIRSLAAMGVFSHSCPGLVPLP